MGKDLVRICTLFLDQFLIKRTVKSIDLDVQKWRISAILIKNDHFWSSKIDFVLWFWSKIGSKCAKNRVQIPTRSFPAPVDPIRSLRPLVWTTHAACSTESWRSRRPRHQLAMLLARAGCVLRLCATAADQFLAIFDQNMLNMIDFGSIFWSKSGIWKNMSKKTGQNADLTVRFDQKWSKNDHKIRQLWHIAEGRTKCSHSSFEQAADTAAGDHTTCRAKQ